MMNFFKAYLLGLKTALTHPRVLLTTYLLNALVSAAFFLGAFAFLGKMKARSLELTPLLKDFDMEVVGGFLKENGNALGPLIAVGIGLGAFYWVVNVFLSGGIMSSFRMEKFTMRNFFGASAYNFFSFLLLDILAWGIFLAFFGLLSFGSNTLYDVLNPAHEGESMLFGLGVSGVFAFFALMSIVTITYAKAMLVLNNSVNFIAKFFRAWVFTYSRIYVTLPLVILLLLGPAVVSFVYLKLELMFHSGTTAAILIGFVLQQAFILLRVFFRIWIMSSHLEFYDRQYLQKKLLAEKEEA